VIFLRVAGLVGLAVLAGCNGCSKKSDAPGGAAGASGASGVQPVMAQPPPVPSASDGSCPPGTKRVQVVGGEWKCLGPGFARKPGDAPR
jgi:hypothetical protein